VIYVARQLGHGADLTLKVYGHVIEDLEDTPRLSADEAIRAARETVFGTESARFLPDAPARNAEEGQKSLF
jgi:hypothetical protein